jgi:hypothetical protein
VISSSAKAGTVPVHARDAAGGRAGPSRGAAPGPPGRNGWAQLFSTALLLTGSPWAAVAVLVLVALVTASILAVVIALIDEGELGDRLRRYIPGLPAPPRP